MKRILTLLVLWFFIGPVWAGKVTPALPGQSITIIPLLKEEIELYWPDLDPYTFPAGIIDQESQFKINALLLTKRERGCGLGQFTIAYDAKGNIRFDALKEAKRLDPSLAGWNWKDCQNVRFQLRAVVLKLKQNERFCATLMNGNIEVKACDAATYNGGNGSISKRIRACRLTKDCIVTKWYGHLEHQCPQAKVKVAGYGESFCEINSKYPSRVMARMPKFELILQPDQKLQLKLIDEFSHR